MAKPVREKPGIARTADEIKFAHDLVIDLLDRLMRMKAPVEEPIVQWAMDCASVLCWILGHGHTVFNERLEQVAKQFLASQRPYVPEESIH